MLLNKIYKSFPFNNHLNPFFPSRLPEVPSHSIRQSFCFKNDIRNSFSTTNKIISNIKQRKAARPLFVLFHGQLETPIPESNHRLRMSACGVADDVTRGHSALRSTGARQQNAPMHQIILSVKL